MEYECMLEEGKLREGVDDFMFEVGTYGLELKSFSRVLRLNFLNSYPVFLSFYST